MIRSNFDVDNFACVTMDSELKIKTWYEVEFDLKSKEFEILIRFEG